MKAIVLAEKPSVAKEMARVLNCNKKTKGYFEGSRYIVTWALGHLVTLAEPHEYNKKYKEWRMEHLPMLPDKMKLKIIRQTSHQFRVVSDLLRRKDVSEMVIATDAGREGELVARWIMRLSGWKKPFKRLWISSQTDSAIKDGFAKLKPGGDYDNLFHAAVCRSEADWLIGLNVTRALTCKFETQLSAGRVQTPTLAMIIQREEEIRKFVPKTYWTVDAHFGDYFGTWQGKNGNRRFFDQVKANAVAEKVKDSEGVIRDVKLQDKTEPPPLAYDLTELQRDANRRYGFSAKKTLSVLQGLYERHKLVTYPRTDSRYITTDMVGTLGKRLDSMSVGPYVNMVKNMKQKNPGLKTTKRLVNDARVSDHHAIIPTEEPLRIDKLENDERRLYDLIARRFITVLYPVHRYRQTTIVTEVNGEMFYSSGKVVVDAGWRAVGTVFQKDDDEGEQDALPEQTLKQQKKGDRKPVSKSKVKMGKTRPPARYTEATLLTAMESPGKFIDDEELRESIKDGGLGTPATRAEIIEKLLNSYYIERQGKCLVPTSKGVQLIDLVPEQLKSPELTAKWEKRLSLIAKGKEKSHGFMADIRKNAVELVNCVKTDTKEFKLDNLTKNPCPMCGKMMMSVKGKKGQKLVCSDGRCGYEQSEKQEDGFQYKSSRKEKAMGKRMIDRFSDNKKKAGSGTLGDLFEQALGKK